jgi:enoyl-CoA hydratase
MSGFETVIYEKEDGVASVTLNRPRVLNAIDLTMRDELWTLFEAVRLDPDVGVVVFRGAGGRAFSSGADIRDFGSAPSYVEARRARQERDLWRLLLAIEKPLIASLHGHVVGAGLELSLCCDLRIAGESARLGLPELALGYLPAAGGSQTLPRMVGPGRALHMILSGEPVDAAAALAAGLVQWVVPDAELAAATAALARRVLARPARALRLAKEAVVGGLDLPLAAGLGLEARLRARL